MLRPSALSGSGSCTLDRRSYVYDSITTRAHIAPSNVNNVVAVPQAFVAVSYRLIK